MTFNLLISLSGLQMQLMKTLALAMQANTQNLWPRSFKQEQSCN